MNIENKTFVLVIAAHKAGTTSFYGYLRGQKDVFVPLIKELHFFTPLVYDESHKVNLEAYYKLFNGIKDEKYVVDISPSYLYGGRSLIDMIRTIPANIRIALILRNPAERFISFYKQGLKTGAINSNIGIEQYFGECLQEFREYQATGKKKDNFLNRGLREGCYVKYLKDWLEAFDDLKIIFFEDLVQYPAETMTDFSQWLGASLSYDDNYNFSQENRSVKPKLQWLSQVSLRIFRRYEKFFRKNERIKTLLKGIYNKVNTEEYKKENHLDIKQVVKEFYSPYNQELKRLLPQYEAKIDKWN